MCASDVWKFRVAVALRCTVRYEENVSEMVLEPAVQLYLTADRRCGLGNVSFR